MLSARKMRGARDGHNEAAENHQTEAFEGRPLLLLGLPAYPVAFEVDVSVWNDGDTVRVGGEGERLTVFHSIGGLACCRRPGSEGVTLAQAETLELVPPDDGGVYMRCEAVFLPMAPRPGMVSVFDP
jgi:hypothetical protein